LQAEQGDRINEQDADRQRPASGPRSSFHREASTASAGIGKPFTRVKEMLAAAREVVPSRTATQAKALIASGKAVVVDLLDAPEVEKTGKIAGAITVSHRHSKNEFVKVISFAIGVGKKFDCTAGKTLPAGARSPSAGMPHYAWANGETIVQVNGTGPFNVKYVDPKDAPNSHSSPGAKNDQQTG
jgi:hypothetical protein